MADIILDRVRKQYGSVTIIDDLSLKVHHGEFFTLLGPSGCGKTTLLRMIAGFIQPTSGRVMIGEEDVTHLPAHKRETGMVFQDYALFPDKTVFDNVAYGLRVRRVSGQQIKERVARILDRVELGHLPSRFPGELSGGQRQRVALARALVIEPRILLMDEPLSNLDAKLRIQMRDVIRELQQELQITTVFVTHDQEEALSMSDRIALLKGGRIDQLDDPEALYGQPISAYAADFIGAANLINIDSIGHDGEYCTVAIAGGVVRVQGGRRDDKVCLAVRPEHVQMAAVNKDGEPSMNADHHEGGSIEATVVFRRYLGFKVTYCLRLADGSTINADLPASRDPRCQAGQTVRVSFGINARLVTAVEPSA